jgi:hypothetical protein
VVLEDRFRVSQRRACRLTGQHRNTQRRPVPLADIEEQKLKRRIRELARRHVRWGGVFQESCHSLAAIQAAWIKGSARSGSGSSVGLLIHTSAG